MSEGPQINLEAEEHLLGAMLVSEGVIGAVLAEHQLDAEAFYRNRHRLIYEAIRSLFDRGEPVDVVTVGETLDARGRLKQIGGPDTLAALVAKVPAPGRGPHYAGIVVRKAELRRIDAAAKSISQAVAAGDEIGVADARAMLDAATPRGRRRLEGEQLEDMAFALAAAEPDSRPVYPWPLRRLNMLAGQGNESIGGIRPGQLVAIGAGTHFGKTAWTQQCLDSFAKAGARCAYYFNEMDPEEHLGGIVQRNTGITTPELLSGKMGERSRKTLLGALSDGSLRRWPLVPIHGQRPEEVCAEIRLAGDDIAAVDILHNFVFDPRNVVQELSNAVALFYETARSSGTAILLSAHFNRNTVIGGRRLRPTRYDFRGTGDIENKADIVLLIDREVDPETNEVHNDGDRTAVYFDKYRGGWLGGYWGPEHPLRFDEKRLRFLPAAQSDPFAEPLRDITESTKEAA